MKQYVEPAVELIILRGNVVTESGNPVEMPDDWSNLLIEGGQ